MGTVPTGPVAPVPDTLLAAEAGIVARLQQATQQGPDRWCRKVATRDYLASVAEEMQDAPAIYVVYDGLVVFDADEQRASLGHRWLVVVAVAVTSPQQRDAAPRNSEGGRYMAAVLHALHGLTLPEHTHGLVPTTPPRPYYSEGKFAYFPLAFMARAHFSTRTGLAGRAPLNT